MPFEARPLTVSRQHRVLLEWALRARIILAGGRGEGIRETARRLDVTPATVCQWRARYAEGGVAALKTRARSGRPRRITDAKERAVVAKTLTPPKARTHWSSRSLAKEVGLSPATVHRIWQKCDLQPHRTTTFKFSTDPEFEEKLADI